jgi:hypothetical protein
MSQPRSAEATLREHLENVGSPTERLKDAAAPASSGIDAADNSDLRRRYGLRQIPQGLSENLSILARWFYSKPREGEIFFRDREWPYRRLLRACARLLNPAVSPSPPEVPPAPNPTP